MNEQQASQVIQLLTEIRDLLKGGAVSSPAGGNTFPAQKMTATIDDGRVFWKIKGGMFQKFGVMVWPEVLEAAGFNELDPLKVYDLTGYTAVYTTNGDGKPKKVTQLTQERPPENGDQPDPTAAMFDPKTTVIEAHNPTAFYDRLATWIKGHGHDVDGEKMKKTAVAIEPNWPFDKRGRRAMSRAVFTYTQKRSDYDSDGQPLREAHNMAKTAAVGEYHRLMSAN